MTSRAKYHDGKPTTKQRILMAEHDRNVFAPTPTMRGRTGIQFISDSALKQAEKEAQLAEKLRQKKIEDRKKRLSVLAERAKSSERPVTTNLGNPKQRSYSKNLAALSSAPPLVLRSRTEEEQEQQNVRESLGEGEKRHWQATEETYNPAELLRKTRRQNRGGKRKRRKTRKRRRKPKTRRRKKIRKKRKRRKTRKRKRRRRGGVAAGFLGEASCGEVKLDPMYQDCCELEKAELRARFLAVEQRRRRQQHRARQRRGRQGQRLNLIQQQQRQQQQPEQQEEEEVMDEEKGQPKK